ncbi:MAG: tetraacyldisaccharide 4'-kinase [Holosporales bacterium]
MLRAPQFWQSPPGIGATLLQPLACLYHWGGQLKRCWSRPQKAPLPVLSVGNLTLGGAGKTPVALALHHLLFDQLSPVHFVSRGYGRKTKGTLQVEVSSHTSDDVGDEPLLLARQGVTWVSRDRFAGCVCAHQAGAQAVILDDGHQQTWVEADCGLVVVDAQRGLGNGLVFPAGPLREDLKEGLARAHALVVVGEGEGVLPQVSCPVFRAFIRPQNTIDVAGRRVVGFAGLAYPEKFLRTLQDVGAQVCDFKAFADHHAYSQGDLASLRHVADRHGAQLVTTAKDWVRLPKEMQPQVMQLEITLQFEDPQGICDFVLEKLKNGSKS